MEAKRSNYQTLHKPESSKMQVLKTVSEVSLTPSMAVEQTKINARKNPLDALSRLSLRQQDVEKRSGLQDVDDEYFKKNIFSRSNLNKHSRLNDSYEQQGHATSLAQGDASRSQVQQHQSKQQPNLPQVQPTTQSTQPNQIPAEIASQQQQQMPSRQSQLSPPMQCKNQSYKESHPQSQPELRKQHLQQQQPKQSSVASVVEPELCTTCPNCQTTIYLVRGHDNSGEPLQGYSSIHHDTTNSTSAN